MKCPTCGAPTEVKDTRYGFYRRRECYNGHRFSTHEKVVSLKAGGPRKTGHRDEAAKVETPNTVQL